MTTRPRVLSGITPSGPLTLGNHLGASVPCIELMTRMLRKDVKVTLEYCTDVLAAHWIIQARAFGGADGGTSDKALKNPW